MTPATPWTSYFDQFEARAAYDPISLRALSYALHIDTKTLRSWVRRDLLQPDVGGGYLAGDGTSGLFFRLARIDEIRRQFGLAHDPATAEDWTERFLRFARQGRSLVGRLHHRFANPLGRL